MNKSVSTISDELARNSRQNSVYDPDFTHHKTCVRRSNASFRGKKIIQNNDLREFVEQNFIDGKTPEAIAGRLKNQEKELPYASKDTIYRYQQSPYGKILGVKKKKKKGKFGYQAKKELRDRNFIEKRPKIIELRNRVGDIEADFIVSGKSGKGILLVAVCRKLRVVFLVIIYQVTIQNIENALLRIKRELPEMKTLTIDNDILFRYHKELEKLLRVKIYFCNPYHSWEKGTVENVNKHIRKKWWVPISLDTLSTL